MKPEQLEVARLKREVTKLKAERDRKGDDQLAVDVCHRRRRHDQPATRLGRERYDRAFDFAAIGCLDACPSDCVVCCEIHQHADAPHPLRLLRSRCDRPGRRAAEQRDELAPF
jgi:hypothetical protein